MFTANNNVTIHDTLVILSLLLFGFASVIPFPVPSEPWRLKAVSAGLFFLTLSTFF